MPASTAVPALAAATGAALAAGPAGAAVAAGARVTRHAGGPKQRRPVDATGPTLPSRGTAGAAVTAVGADAAGGGGVVST